MTIFEYKGHLFKIETEIKKTKLNKCARCWRYRESVGEEREVWGDMKWPDLCDRCCSVVENMYVSGELKERDLDLHNFREKQVFGESHAL